VSSCTKLFPILLVIWPSATSGASNEQQAPGSGLGRAFMSNASNYTGWVVLLNNIEALLILLDCGYMVATSLALAGLVCRWTVEGWALSLVGLRNSSSREVFSNGLGFLSWSMGNNAYS
jgi:lipid intermediate transporter